METPPSPFLWIGGDVSLFAVADEINTKLPFREMKLLHQSGTSRSNMQTKDALREGGYLVFFLRVRNICKQRGRSATSCTGDRWKRLPETKLVLYYTVQMLSLMDIPKPPQAATYRIVDRRENFQYCPQHQARYTLPRVGWSVGKTVHIVKTPISDRSHVTFFFLLLISSLVCQKPENSS